MTSKNATLDRISRALMAGTCLAAAGGTASAGTIIIEGTPPAPADFGNSLGTAYKLPGGTTEVKGYLTLGDTDWFEFTGLGGATPFSLAYGYGEYSLYLFDDSSTPLSLGSATHIEGGNATLTGTIPTDGNIFVMTSSNSAVAGRYDLNMTAQQAPPTVPEPGTLALSALALGGALAWRRGRNKTQA